MIAPMNDHKRRISPLAIILSLSAVFFVIFLLVSTAVFSSKWSGTKTRHSSAIFSAANGSVGVIEMNGVIMDSKKTLKKLESYDEDDDIKAVVLRLNSPGGAVAPSQEIYQAVRDYKKPLVVSMSSVAASGAFYIASGAKKVFANPGTITGSIGVIMEFANLEKLYDWLKIHRFAIKTGKYKDAGAEYREMTADERALLQGMVDDVLSQFKDAVSKGRKLPLDKVTAIADGRIFSGAQAKALNLVDELGGIHEAIDAAAKMANIKGKPNVVYPTKSRKWLDILMDDGSKDDEAETHVNYSVLGNLLHELLGDSASALVPGGSQQQSSALAPGVYWLWKGAY